MLKSIIRRAVEAAFSTEEFEEAIADEIADLIDYRMVALEVLSTYDVEDLVARAADEYALDLISAS